MNPSGALAGWCRALLIVPALLLCACEPEATNVRTISGGDEEQGHRLIAAIKCGVCHIVPGVDGARGVVGPSLEQFGERQLIGGVLPNDPATLAKWVRDAPSLIPDTGMPSLPLDAAQSRDIAAYLYTLR